MCILAVETTWAWAWPWWETLVALNVIHLFIGVFLFVSSNRANHPVDVGYLKMMRTMGMIFVAVALYRSIFVSSYLRQLAWFNSVLNSSLLIRSFAFFAELSFAGLIAKSLLRINEDVPELINRKNKLLTFLQTKTPIIFFVCIFIANLFATGATITKVYLFFAVEETFWGIGFVIIIPMLIISIRKLSAYRNTAKWNQLRQLRIATILIAVFSIGYSFFELGFNLPIVNWPGAVAQLQMPIPDPPIRFSIQALIDALLIVHETKDLNTWGGMGFIFWHTGYFSVCVWIALFLMTGPRILKITKADT